MSASIAASVVGIAGGINALTGGSITNALGMGPSGGSSGGSSGGQAGGGSGGGNTNISQYDPYSQYRPQAAQQLQDLMADPSIAMNSPAYQQQLQQGMQTTSRGMAATGQLQSGGEQVALNTLGQNTFGSFYNSMLANLMQMSGASQSPAAAGMAQTQAALANKSMQTAGIAQTSSGLGMLTGGMNQMAQAWNAPTNQQSSAQNIAGYGSTGASYQQSFGSDTQFGTYDSGAYQGPV